MKRYRTFLLLSLFCLSAFSIQAQGLLGIGSTGITGFPATSQFGDTIQNLGLWVVNKGLTPVANLNIAFLSQTNSTGTPFQIGDLDLTSGVIQPGDSLYVPLDYFIVTPQNSNQGSNVMVIWPTSPGTTPSDSAETDYEVDGATAAVDAGDSYVNPIQIWPNPCSGSLNLHTDQANLKGSRVRISDIQGRLITEVPLQFDHVFDFTKTGPGIFLLQIEKPNGTIFHRRIINR